jgi:integrase
MEVQVKVVKLKREHLALRWVDPFTGKVHQKTAGTADYREATKLAGKLEDELRGGRYVAPSKLTWDQFRDRFEQERYPGMTPGNIQGYEACFNAFEREMLPLLMARINSAAISVFRSKLFRGSLREATITKHLRHLKAALRWASAVGMLAEVPVFEMPKRGRGAKLMKGRPLSNYEFLRMLAAVRKVVPAHEVDGWRFFLRGLWLSGLRLNEAINLYWDRNDRLRIDLSGKCPLLHIPGELQKSGKDQVCAVAPEFAALLDTVPDCDRHGQVFKLGLFERIRPADWKEKASKVGCAIGKAARVVVATDVRTGRDKSASVHDLRRSFGDRWSRRVLPQVLQELMRHESIATTLRFYVGRSAERTWEALQGWEVSRGKSERHEV